MPMVTHYLMVALRNTRRTPFIAAVNVLTLALGLICFLAAYGVATFWDRSEQHFQNAHRTFVVTTNVTPREDGTGSGTNTMANPYVAQYLRADYPAIEAVARARRGGEIPVANGERIARLFNVYADAELLDIFDLPFTAGHPRDALREPRSVVLTQEAAQRLFPGEDPLGKTVRLQSALDVTVTGVISAVPEPSHLGRSATATLRFDMLTSMDAWDWFDANARPPNAPPPPENWLATGVSTYVLLPADGSLPVANLERQLGAFVARHAPPLQLGYADVKLGLLPVTKVLGRASSGAFFLRNSGITVPTALLLLGALVLAVACINYANLATARAIGRARDVGLRKVFGARATQVTAQYLLEAAWFTTSALLVALAALALLTPALIARFGIDLRLSLFGDPAVWISIAGLVAIVTLIAGGYPSFVLSRVPPALTVRAGSLQLGARSLATVLVGVQFMVASVLLIVVAVTYLQNRELERTGLGIASDPLLVVQNNRVLTRVDPSTLRDELLGLPQVQAVGTMAWPPWTMYHNLSLSRSADESAPERLIFRYIVGYDFFSALEIPILAGRVFDREHTDVLRPQEPQNIVVDRALIEEFELGSPADAIDEIVYIPKRLTAGFGGTAAQPMRIIGVVETQPLAMVTTGAQSTIYTFQEPLPFQIVRVSASDVSGALEGIDRLWDRLAPGIAIERRFVDDYFDQNLQNFTRIGQTFAGITVLALLISTIGLFSMAMLVVGRRAREIGVRKTFGAHTAQMIVLLLRGFSGPVLVANIVAWPVAYMAARIYLDAFIHPIDLTPMPFIVCLAFTLGISWLVVCSHTWRTASLNPAQVLRTE